MILPSRILSLLSLLPLPALLWAQAQSSASSNPPRGNPPSVKATTGSGSSGSSQQKSTSAPAPSKKTTAAPKAKAKTAVKRPAARTTRQTPSVLVGQRNPTKDRYSVIQKRLADAGYFSGAANGAWGSDSVKALQQFQQDQGLEPTGKIDSITLIKLDLGPQYDSLKDPGTAASPPPG